MQQVLNTECVRSPRTYAKVHRTAGDGETQCGKVIPPEWWDDCPPANRNQCCKACFGNDDIVILIGYVVPE